MYVYNDEMLSMPQQVAKNKEDIKTLQNTIPYPINWRGLWNQEKTYNKYDGVNFQGSSYVCISDVAIQSTTPPPQAPFVWQVFAQQGEQGPTGETGPTGPIGLPALAYDDYLVETSDPALLTPYYLTKSQFNRTPTSNERFNFVYKNTNTNVLYYCYATIMDPNYSTLTVQVTLIRFVQLSGTDGKGFNFMGAWVSGSDHYINDVVTYNGNAYVCISDITNSTTNPASDTTHWAIFTSAPLYFRHDITISDNTDSYKYNIKCTIILKNSVPLNNFDALNNAIKDYPTIAQGFVWQKNAHKLYQINMIMTSGNSSIKSIGLAISLVLNITPSTDMLAFSDLNTVDSYDTSIVDIDTVTIRDKIRLL